MGKSRKKLIAFSFFNLFLIVLVLFLYTRKNEKGRIEELVPEKIAKTAQQSDEKGCLHCHGPMEGLAPGHREFECTTCHLGLKKSNNKDSAHTGMVIIPGNFNDMQTTCGLCHPEAVNNIKNSLMSTNSGLVSIDRYIFGELDSPNGHAHIKDIGHSAADEHLRNLCARCHLGMEKTETGPITQLSRGGGCNACHLNYSEKALADYNSYHNDSILPVYHASLDLTITNEHCFGCHSRSGRIATNYEGFTETTFNKNEIANKKGLRVLADERVFKYINPDVHHEKGMACIDCHTYNEVMGDGKLYMHEEDAVKLRCTDCHFEGKPLIIEYDSLDYISKRILSIRKFKPERKAVLKTHIEGHPMLNTYVDLKGNSHLTGKLNGKDYLLNSPGRTCTRGDAHNEVSCSACHTSWAPQCLGCHIEYETDSPGYDLLENKKDKGTWREYAGSFLSGPPTLGVRVSEKNNEVTPAIPGMIMTLDKSNFKGKHHKPDSLFVRLFAPAEPHTITKKGRSCTSCHTNSLAIGYGRGQLTFIVDDDQSHWVFEPEYSDNKADGLPMDAWTGFLKDPSSFVSTRTNFRPFNIEEQKRILTVGACFTCHKEKGQIMQKSLDRDFGEYLKIMSPECRKPIF